MTGRRKEGNKLMKKGKDEKSEIEERRKENWNEENRDEEKKVYKKE